MLDLIRTSRLLLVIAMIVVVGGALLALTADFETDPVDATWADDPAFWQHPTDLGQSLILGTGKESSGNGNLVSFNLNGATHQDIDTFRVNNVDVRGDTVCFSTRAAKNITCLTMDPVTRLMDAGAPVVIPASPSIGLSYGSCMYQSATGLYAFVTDKDGDVEQYNVATGALVRAFDVGTQTEGCVGDDAAGTVFFGEENVAIWAYGGEPSSGSARVLVDVNDPDGHFFDDVEGLAIYKNGTTTGYLLASSQGSDEFVVYDREPPYAHLATFAVDGVGGSDGVEAVALALPGFPSGIFITHDDNAVPENFKVVDWAKVQAVIDGAPPPPPTPTPPVPTPTATPVPPTPTPVPGAPCVVTVAWTAAGLPQTFTFTPTDCAWTIDVN